MAEAAQPPASYLDRVAERQIYLDFLTKDSPWVMMVTGIEGNGKSEFLIDIRDHTPTHDTRVILLNFAIDTLQKDALSILEYLVSRIALFCDAQIVGKFKDILYTSRVKLSDYNLLIVQQHRVGSHAASTENNQDITISDDMEAGRRQQIRAVVESAFFEVLDSFRLSRLVILIDNCEWINENENSLPESIEVSQWLVDKLIPEVYEHMQGSNKHCSVVLASSIPPALKNIPQRYQISCNLDRLDAASVDLFLAQIGVHDAEMRHYIYEHITHGHACCVWIVIKIWQASGPFMIEELPRLQSLFKEQALHQFLHHHIFEKHPRSPFRSLIHYGALLRSFDQPLLEAVFPEWMPPSEAFQRFHKLILYPYIIQNKQNGYMFIDLLREVLTHCIRLHETARWQEYQAKALNFLTKIAHPDRFYHALLYDEQTGLKSWKEAVEQAYDVKQPDDIAILLDIIHDQTLTLSPAATAEGKYQQGRFYEYNKQYEKALLEFKQAQDLYRKVGDALNEAEIQQAIHNLQQVSTSKSSSTKAHL